MNLNRLAEDGVKQSADDHLNNNIDLGPCKIPVTLHAVH